MAFGDRRDAKMVRKIDGMHSLIPHVKPHRCDSDVYINQKFDVTNLVEYMEKNKDNDITYFHVFCTALAKVVYNRPLLNRYIINGKFFDRKEVSISFVAKTKFEDEAEEFFSLVKVKENDNINTISKMIAEKVKKVRTSSRNKTDDVINIVGKLPKMIRSIIWHFINFLDKHDWLPNSLIENDIYHSTILVSNLGSIGCNAIYHNLTNFGTNSILVTIGKIRKEYIVNENNKPEIRYICEFGVNIDERIADGFYFVKAIKIIQHIFDNPELLEENVNEKIEEK